MVTGALVYDWLYSLTTPSEKEIIIQELIRLAPTLECGYPPTKQGNVVGHSSESFIMRDMLAAGIAFGCVCKKPFVGGWVWTLEKHRERR